MLQADVAVCGELSPCSGRAACSFGDLSPGAARLFPPGRAARAASGLAPSPRECRAFSLCGPSARRWSGLIIPVFNSKKKSIKMIQISML